MTIIQALGILIKLREGIEDLLVSGRSTSRNVPVVGGYEQNGID